MGMRARVFPLHAGMLLRRWEPGYGYQGYPGITGLADSGEVDEETTGWDAGAVDNSSGEAAGGDLVDFGTKEDCADLSLWSSVEARNAFCYPTVSTGANTTPGEELTPEERVKQSTAAQAWILKNVPNFATAAASLALTADQIASGLAVGTVVRAAACPSGYKYSTGVCVPPLVGGGAPAGQWVSFATNKQLVTWGAVVLGALVLVNLIPSGGGGGGRRRR